MQGTGALHLVSSGEQAPRYPNKVSQPDEDRLPAGTASMGSHARVTHLPVYAAVRAAQVVPGPAETAMNPEFLPDLTTSHAAGSSPAGR